MSVTSKLKHEMCLAVGIKKRSRWNKAEEQHGFELVEQYLSERWTSIDKPASNLLNEMRRPSHAPWQEQHEGGERHMLA